MTTKTKPRATFMAALFAAMRRWIGAFDTHGELATLSDRELRDIGLARHATPDGGLSLFAH